MKKIFLSAMVILLCITANAFCLDTDGLMQVLADAKQGISGVFVSVDHGLSAAARELSSVDLKSDAARKILNNLCQNRPYVIDCAIIDTTGRMIAVEPAEYGEFEGKDISAQMQVQLMLLEKRPLLSSVFSAIEGRKAIDFGYPIFSDKKEFLGSVSMLVDQVKLAEDIILPLVWRKHCKIWIMQKDGVLIYDPDLNQIGRNVFKDNFFSGFNVLVSFCRTLADSKEGMGSYDFYAAGMEDKTVVSKYAAWDTVSLYGNEWRIVVMEADKPKPAPEEKP